MNSAQGQIELLWFLDSLHNFRHLSNYQLVESPTSTPTSLFLDASDNFPQISFLKVVQFGKHVIHYKLKGNTFKSLWLTQLLIGDTSINNFVPFAFSNVANLSKYKSMCSYVDLWHVTIKEIHFENLIKTIRTHQKSLSNFCDNLRKRSNKQKDMAEVQILSILPFQKHDWSYRKVSKQWFYYAIAS